MNMFERAGSLFQTGAEHSLYGNAALIGAAVMGEVVVANEAPELFDFGFVAAFVIALPAMGRIIDTLKLQADNSNDQT